MVALMMSTTAAFIMSMCFVMSSVLKFNRIVRITNQEQNYNILRQKILIATVGS